MHVSEEEVKGWFAGRIPQGWFAGPPEVEADREEILIVGTLPDVELGKGTAADAIRAARAGITSACWPPRRASPVRASTRFSRSWA